MSNDDNPNISIKMTESSVRQYTNEETNNEKILKILPGKHNIFIDENDDNLKSNQKSSNSKKKRECKFLYNLLLNYN